MVDSTAAAALASVGFGRAVITPGPEHWPIWLSGFGDRHEPADSVHDDLEVRVLLATDGSATVAVLALDLMAMSIDWATAIRAAVAAELGIDPAGVLTHTIHTHSAPSTISGTDALGWRVPHAWRADLIDACLDAVRSAREALRPARVRFARVAQPDGLAFNRREHPYTPSLAVLDVCDEAGERLGTVANIGVHPVTLGPHNLAVSADWPHALRTGLEARLGGTAMFVQGCQGDVDPTALPWDAPAPERFAAAEQIGDAFATAVAGALAAAVPSTGPVRAHRRTVTLPAGGAPLAAITGITELEVELVSFEIAGVHVVALPGEGFSALGERIVQAYAPDPVLLCGLAPHWLGYLPVPFAGGYEEGLSYGADVVRSIADELAVPPRGAAAASRP